MQSSGISWIKLRIQRAVSHRHLILSARFYALHGGEQNEGYVFTLDVAALLAHDVKVLRVCEHVKEPSVPEDDEYILVPPAGLAVPQAAVVDLVRVATA